MPKAAEDERKVGEMKDALIIDYKYCTGCHACEVTCRNEKGFSQEEWGIKLTEHGPKKLGGKWVWNYVPVPSPLCDLCAERRAAGGVAPCTIHCLGQCMEIVPIEKLSEALENKGDSVAVFIP